LHHQPTDRRELIIMMTTTELAATLDTTPRTLRKFLRAQGAGVGKGSRYALPSTKRDINTLTARFTAWNDARTPSTDDDPATD
jgi:phage antirepressor YoqD-like protein